jgi:hypothetical protein
MASAGVPGREVARQTHARDDDTPRRLTGIAGVGSSLPILLVFGIEGTAFADTINREAVAEQVIAMLVGSIGLILAVPVTTALAAILATGLPSDELDTTAHAH